ncbi:MAG: AsmA-like C-terminal region-containing protein [Planctomycetaceae bacterium]
MSNLKSSATGAGPEESPSVLRRFRWIVILLVVLFLLPSVLSLSGQQQALTKLIGPEFSRNVRIGSITAHWWSPVLLQDVAVRDVTADDDGQAVPVVAATSVRTVEPLWKLAMNLGQGAQMIVTNPVVNLRVSDGRTNLEDTLAALSGSQAKSSGGTFPISVTVENGLIRLLPTHAAALVPGTSYTAVSGINGTFSTLNPAHWIPDVSLVADIGDAAALASVAQSPEAARKSGLDPRIAASLNELAGDFPLVPFSESQLAVLGQKTDEPSLKIQISDSPQHPGTQVLSLEASRLKLGELEPVIQRVFPGTICMGDVSCRVQAYLLQENSTDGFAGRVQLLGENLRWRHRDWAVGESLDLESVTVQGALAMADDGLMVNDLKVASSLLTMTGQGEVKVAKVDPAKAIAAAAADQDAQQREVIAEATAAAAGLVRLDGQLDLAALTRMLPRTLHVADDVAVDSGAVQFSVRIQQEPVVPDSSNLFAQSAASFQWQLATQTSALSVRNSGRQVTLDSPIRLDAMGVLSADAVRVSRGRVTGAFGTLSADPEEDMMVLSGTVNPERLWTDLRQIVDIPRPGLKSDLTANAKVRWADSRVHLSSLSLISDEVTVESPGLTIDPTESIVRMFSGTLSVNGSAPAIKTMVSPWHSADWLSDQATVAARLGADPTSQLTLQLLIQRNPVMRNASLYRTISSSGKTVASASPMLSIDQAKLDLAVVADAAPGTYRIQQGQLELPGLNAALNGQLSVTASGDLLVNLDANTGYDLSVLSSQLMAESRNVFQLSGQGQETFHIEGVPAALTAADFAESTGLSPSASAAASGLNQQPLHVTGRLGWTSGRIYGLPLGPATVVAELKDGVLRTEPLHCAIGSGELDVMAQWEAASNRLQLAPGSRIQNLDVTRELSSEWLGYLLPMMADAASVTGQLSVRLQQFNCSLSEPSLGTLNGTMTVHRAVATPGPSVQPLLQVFALIDRNSGSRNQQLELPPQDIPFDVQNGVVTHDGLRMQVGQYLISSRGSVGILDRQVQLALTIPLEKNASAPDNSRTLQVPVRGTIDRPQPDVAGLLQNLGTQQVTDQINQRVNDQLGKGLDRLFKKLK